MRTYGLTVVVDAWNG